MKEDEEKTRVFLENLLGCVEEGDRALRLGQWWRDWRWHGKWGRGRGASDS